MKTAILTIALALASALSALAQTVMRENSTVYFQTNVYLHDDPTNALHTRISVEGQEPLWVAASNQVVYYLGGEITNAWIHARYIHATNMVLGGIARTNWPGPEYVPIAGGTMTGALNMGGQSITNADVVGYAKYESVTNFAGSGGVKTAILLSYDPASDYSFTLVNNGGYIWGAWKSSSTHEYEGTIPLFYSPDGTYALWQGRVNDTEAGRITAAAMSAVAAVSGRVDTVEGWGDHADAGYLTDASSWSEHPATSTVDFGGSTISNTTLLIDSYGHALEFDDGTINFANAPAIRSVGGTNRWEGRINDTEASRIAALPVNPMIFNSNAWLQSDGTNLFFVSTVPPGFTNALTTNAP